MIKTIKTIKITKRRIKLTVIILIIGVIIVSMLSNDLRRPVEHIQDKLLSQMPLGSSEDEVIEFILQHEDWILDDRVSYAEPGANLDGGHIARTRKVNMGYYNIYLVFRVSVVAYWRFDEDGKLFQLMVRKYFP